MAALLWSLNLLGTAFMFVVWCAAGILGVELLATLFDSGGRRLKAIAPGSFPFKNLSLDDRGFLQKYLLLIPKQAQIRAALAWVPGAVLAWGVASEDRMGFQLATAWAVGLAYAALIAAFGNALMVRRVVPFFFFEENYAANLEPQTLVLKRKVTGYKMAVILLVFAGLFIPSAFAGLGWAYYSVLAACVAAMVYFLRYVVSVQLTQPLNDLRSALQRFGQGDYGALLDVPSGDEIGHATEAFNKAVRATDRRFFIQETFGYMVPEDKSPMIFEDGLKLDGEERDIAVLCARLSAGAPPAVFNKFCSLVMEQGAKEGGGLDEVGEGMVVLLFGAPFKAEKPGLAAATAAAKLKDALPVFQTQQKMQARVEVSATLAVAEGKATVGLVGPKGKQRYSALGGPARLARELSLKAGVWVKVEGLPAGFEVDGQGRLLKGPLLESPDISKGIPGLGFQPGERL